MTSKFNLDEWWDKNVDPELSALDLMYKEITKEVLEEVIKIYDMNIKIEEKQKEDDIDLEDLDLSSIIPNG